MSKYSMMVVLLLVGHAMPVGAIDLTGTWGGSTPPLRCKQVNPGQPPTAFEAAQDLAVTQTGNDIFAQLSGSGISSEVSGLYFGGVVEKPNPALGKGLITMCRIPPFDSLYSATSIEFTNAKTFPVDHDNVSGKAAVRVVHYFSPVGSTSRSLIICRGSFRRFGQFDPGVPACP